MLGTEAASLFISSMVATLLVYGAYTDVRTGKVSNLVTYTIAFLCLFMLNFESDLIMLKVYIAVIYLIGRHFQFIGGADVKAVIPIMFTLIDIQFLWFVCTMLVLFGTTFAITHNMRRSPMFPSIALAYIITWIV